MKKQFVLVVMAVSLLFGGVVEIQKAGMESKQEIFIVSKDLHPDPIPEG